MIQLGKSFISVLPVAVKSHHLTLVFVNHQDVWCSFSFSDLVAFELHEGLDVVNSTDAVDVVAFRVTTFDLVVCLFGFCFLGHLGRDVCVDVFVQPRLNSDFELFLRDVLELRDTLCGVEVASCERQVDVVDRHKLSAWALLSFVPPHLHVLRTAQWELGQHLLLLVSVFLDLLGQLPVHVVTLALCLGDFLLGNFANDLRLHWSIGWEQFLNRTSSKVYTSLSHNRVNDFGSAHELCTSRSVVT